MAQVALHLADQQLLVLVAQTIRRKHLVHVQIYVQDSLYPALRGRTQLPYAQHDVVVGTPPCAVLQHMQWLGLGGPVNRLKAYTMHMRMGQAV